IVDETVAEAAIIGGAILGGGGGGWVEEGRRLAQFALKEGFREILPLEAFEPGKNILTVSAVGAPSAGADVLLPEDYVRAVELFLEKSSQEICGLMSSEVGAMAVANGWVQSAYLGIPAVDAAANGRAHPLGLMGSMGLHREKGFVSRQAAVGRRPSTGTQVERFFEGSIEETSQAVRNMAAELGGMVAVARHPIPADYIRQNGAPGAIGHAVSLGRAYQAQSKYSPLHSISAVKDKFGVGIILTGRVKKVRVSQNAGFDVGQVAVETKEGEAELRFLNEYMTLELNKLRLATFPDLIMTFEAGSAMPLITAAVKKDIEVFILTVPAAKLILGAGVNDPDLLGRLESVIGKPITRYILLND
ncbi:MAG: S-methyl thiohydantoin desulfurase domain-containing protein, partial [Candidatus Aminicenantales bacterium]